MQSSGEQDTKIRTGNLSKEEAERNADDGAQPLDARDLQHHGWTLSVLKKSGVEWSGRGYINYQDPDLRFPPHGEMISRVV